MRLAAFLGLALLSIFGSCGASQYAELDALDATQKESLQQLKTGVSGDVPHDYMKEDIYLVKFLQASSYNSSKAEIMVKDMVKWRKENNVDNWEQDATLNAFAEDYPSLENGLDKGGRPVREVPFGKWNVKKALVTGKIIGLSNYAVRSVERCTVKIREQQKQGKDVSEWIHVLNMEGFGPEGPACANCIPLYMFYVGKYEKYYPNTMKEIILVNTPNTFAKFYKLFKPALSERTQKILTIFGTKKEEWKAYLAERIEEDQLADWFGGKKPAPKAPERKMEKPFTIKPRFGGK
jgi:hypothetical protein